MTKEELKQDAEKCLDKMVTDKGIILGCHEGFCYDEVTDFMLEFAEPRERKIKELEAQIEKMKCCGNCGNEKCTSKYRGNSAYHRQSDGYACADNEGWLMKE